MQIWHIETSFQNSINNVFTPVISLWLRSWRPFQNILRPQGYWYLDRNVFISVKLLIVFVISLICGETSRKISPKMQAHVVPCPRTGNCVTVVSGMWTGSQLCGGGEFASAFVHFLFKATHGLGGEAASTHQSYITRAAEALTEGPACGAASLGPWEVRVLTYTHFTQTQAMKQGGRGRPYLRELMLIYKPLVVLFIAQYKSSETAFCSKITF